MYMHEIYLSSNYYQRIPFDREIFKFCVRGDVNEVEKLLKQNENIYQPHKEKLSVVPLSVAIESKDEDLINLLLDVYERDLEALKGTNFKKALIALPEDQNEEFLQTIEDQPFLDSIPVLLKNDNQTIPKCVYLRKRLKHKDDLSLKLARTLEAKNGTCDLNYRKFYDSFCDSFLQIAIYYEIDGIVERLVNHPTVDIMTSNLMSNHTTLHYALYVGNMKILNLLLSKFNFGNYWEDPENFYYAMTSKKERSIKFIINKIFESGKTLQDISESSFHFGYYYYDKNMPHDELKSTESLIHNIARSRNVFILDNPLQFKLKDEDYLKQNSNGDTVLHLILLNQNLKLQAKKKYLRKLSEDFPERLLVKNNFQHLPLHVAAITDTYGQRLFRHLLDLTIEASGNPEIFYEDMEVAVKCLEMAIMNNQGLSEEYLRNFLKVVESHGHRLLIEMIKHSQQLKGIRSILLLGVSINPNQFYGGQNAFLAAVRYDVSHFYQSHNESYSKLKLLLNHHPIDDPNACDETKTSLFMYIVGFTRDNELVKSLINLGADCKARNSENLSCLHFAARNKKNEEILNILLQNGADPSILSDKNELAIDFAIKADILHAVKSLISFLTVDDLKRKSLIQSCTHSDLPEVYNLIWNLYDFHHIDVDINAINENGDSFVMSLMDKFNFKQLETVLKERFDDINFDLINSNGETFTHHLVLHSSQIHEISQLFKDFPLLIDIVNKQINIADKENHLPMDRYFFCFQTECVDELCRNEFLKYLTKENFQQNMHKFIDGVLSLQKMIELYPHIFNELNSNQSFVILDKLSCNTKAFEIAIEKFSDKLPDIKALDGGNILHLICEKNNSEFIDLICKSLSEISIKKLSNERNVNGKKPIELLNEENLTIFEKIFN